MDYSMSLLVGIVLGILVTWGIMHIDQSIRYKGVGIETIKPCSIHIETKEQNIHSNWYEIVWKKDK